MMSTRCHSVPQHDSGLVRLFAGKPARNYTVKMAWVLKYDRARLFSHLIQNKRYRSPAAQKAILNWSRTLGLECVATFEFQPARERLYPKYDVQFATVGIEFRSPGGRFLKGDSGRSTFEAVVVAWKVRSPAGHRGGPCDAAGRGGVRPRQLRVSTASILGC